MAIFSRKRSLLQSQKLLQRERVWRTAKIVFIVVLIAGLFWGLSALSYSSKLTVQNIVVSGNSAVPTDEVIAIAHSQLIGRNFLIFSKANVLWYPKQQIINTLKYSYAWIDTVSVDRVNSTTISIKIKERVPVAVWCGINQQNAVPCQLVDGQSYAFTKAPDFSGSAYLKLYGPLSSASSRGALFFSQLGLDHMLDLTKGLSTIGFQPIATQVTTSNTYDVYTTGGTRISVQVSDLVPTTISNIDSLLTQKLFMESQTSNFSNLVYIDARFGDKLFYKFK